MALAVTLLGAATWNSTAGSKGVTATPAVNDLIVLVTAHSGFTGTVAPTDSQSGTYRNAGTFSKNASADRADVWVREQPIAAATPCTFTHNAAGSTGGGLAVLKVTGAARYGAAAIKKAAALSNQSTGAPSVAMGSAIATGNAVIGAVFTPTNSTTTVVHNASYTERMDLGYNTPATGLEIMTRDSGETGSTVTWGGSATGSWGAIVLELDATTPAATATLSDNFDDNATDTAKWIANNQFYNPATTPGGTVTEANSRVGIAPFTGGNVTGGYISQDFFSLIGSEVVCKFELVGASNLSGISQRAFMAVGAHNGNYYAVALQGANLGLGEYDPTAGVGLNDFGTFAYSPTTHAWWRLRESAGTIFLDTAPSTASNPPISGDWTNRHSRAVASTIKLSGVKVAIMNSTLGADAAAKTVYFDGLNTAASSGTPVAAPVDLAQAQTIDAATTAALAPATPADAAQAQTIDSPTVAAVFYCVPADMAQAQSADSPLVPPNAPVVPADAAQGQTIDQATVTSAGVTIANDLAQGQTIDAATLSFNAPGAVCTPVDLAQAQSADPATVTALAVAAPADAAQGQTIDAATATALAQATPVDLAQGQTIDTAAAVALAPVVPADAFQSQTVDAASATALAVASPADTAQAQTIDAASATALAQAAPADAAQAQTIDVANANAGGVIAVDDVAQAQTTDAPTVTAFAPVTPADAAQAQTLDESLAVSRSAASPADVDQAQAVDAPTVIAYAPVVANDLDQGQALDGSAVVAIFFIAPVDLSQSQSADSAGTAAAALVAANDVEQAQTIDAAVATTLPTVFPPNRTVAAIGRARVAGAVARDRVSRYYRRPY